MNVLYYKSVCFKNNVCFRKICVHEGVKCSCEHWDYKTPKKLNLQAHVKSVHKQVNFYCEHCNYKASPKSHLEGKAT